jgi:hypothetical protein
MHRVPEHSRGVILSTHSASNLARGDMKRLRVQHFATSFQADAHLLCG